MKIFFLYHKRERQVASLSLLTQTKSRALNYTLIYHTNTWLQSFVALCLIQSWQYFIEFVDAARLVEEECQ